MPNDTRTLPLLAAPGMLLCAALLGACATTPPDPALLVPAEEAVQLAEEAGARTHAPLELADARELLADARLALDADEPEQAARLVELAELQARLAIVRTRGERDRAELARKREALDTLKSELREVYGDELELNP